MFTGLVERTGRVCEITQTRSAQQGQVYTLVVDPGDDFNRTLGASVAVNGACLTEVHPQHEGPLTFHVSPETLSKTSLAELKIGSLVNLERAMRPTDRLGGHIVLGHVDGTGEITKIEAHSGFWFVEIKISRNLSRYVVSKGSIAIDGVSLTVNALRDEQDSSYLSFMLIPVTWSSTRFHGTHIGSRVNIEVDMIAKHVERLITPWQDRS